MKPFCYSNYRAALVYRTSRNLLLKAVLAVLAWLPLAWLGGSVACFGDETAAKEIPSPQESLNNNSLFYERDVRPIFKANCFHCHGEEPELQGGLDIRLVRLMQKGGDSGNSLVPGKPTESLIWQKIESDEMPVGAHKLNVDQKNTVRTWIEQGARLAREEPEDPNEAKYTPEELSFWAFSPPVKPELPAVKSDSTLRPIDTFLLAKLQEQGLAFSPEAEKHVLLRRLKVNLLGLVPTREELETFLNDDSEDAYERMVDTYLQSPQYGERWGRHWLDTAGYAESDGNTGTDLVRDHAWRYRDYVIQAFNDNKPFDQFLLEQLAGDEMIEGHIDPANPRHLELITATGFLRMAPDVTQTDNSLVDRNQAVADSMKIVSSTFLGLTVGCAQCHDHRYDPISIEDYYQFRAIFDPAFPIHKWKQPRSRLVDLTTAEINQKRNEIEAVAVEKEKEIEQRRREAAQRILDLRINEAPEDVRAALAEAIKLKPEQQSEEQKTLLASHPRVKSIDTIVGQFIEFDKVFQMKNYQQYVKEREELAAFRATKPIQHFAMAVQVESDEAPESAVMFRGDPEQPTKKVQPAEIFVLARHRANPFAAAALNSNTNESASTDSVEPANSETVVDNPGHNSVSARKRRLQYAQSLASIEHPTVARVAVNRIWQRHFGRGIVGSVNDFGVAGQLPTHPELLDYLACTFVESGWDIKRLHKEILMSRAYRQSSKPPQENYQADPQNRWYSRFPVQRMDAETIRDSMLFVSGTLVEATGGPSIPVTDDGAGSVVIGKRTQAEGLPAKMDDGGGDKYRRSVYIQVRRSKPLSILETFDMPVMTPNCEVRRSTTVAPQSLLFLNDTTVLDASEKLADAVLKKTSDSKEQIVDLFCRLFSSSPTDEEVTECVEFLESQKGTLQSTDANATSEVIAKRTFASLCQALMASNRFLYVE